MTMDVPPKKEIIVYAPLTAKQETLYTAVVNKTIAKILGQEKVMGFSHGEKSWMSIGLWHFLHV